MKKLSLTLALITTGFAASLPAQAESLSISGDVGVYSQYMWRGMQQTAGASSVQGSLGTDIGGGLSTNVWFASLAGPSTEFDFTIDYSGELSGFSYSVGAIHYAYLNAAAGNATEAYIGAGFGPIAATYYYAFSGSWKKNAYLDIALSESLGGFDLGADFGIYLPSNTVANPSSYPTTKSGLGHLDLSISKAVTMGDVSFTPSLMISTPQYSGKPKNANQFVAGMSFSY